MKKKKKTSKRPLILCIGAAAVIIVIACLFGVKGAGFSSEMNKSEYYGIEDASQVPLILNDEILEEKGVLIDGQIYISYPIVWDKINSGFYWDEELQILMLTLPSETKTWSLADASAAVKKDSDGTILIQAQIIKDNSDMNLDIYGAPDRLVMRTKWNGRPTGTVLENTKVHVRESSKSKILTDAAAGDELILLEEVEDWTKVSTKDGYIGYVKTDTVNETGTDEDWHLVRSDLAYSHVFMDEPVIMAWQYVSGNGETVALSELIADVKGLNVLSPTWFYFADTDGNLVSNLDAAYVQLAHERGMKVWGEINDTDGQEIATSDVLSSAAARKTAVEALVTVASVNGLDGINIDFETIRKDSAPQFQQFLKELCQAAHKENLVVSVDNYVPGYTEFYKRAEQAKVVDYIVIMGYDEHTGNTEEYGSVASLPFVEKAIADTLEEVPADQVINALPFYTRGWTTTYGQEGFDSTMLNMYTQYDFVNEHGIEVYWDESVGQYTGSSEDGSHTYSIWLEDEKSIEEKMKVVQKYGLAGVAGWRLGTENTDIWDIIVKYLK